MEHLFLHTASRLRQRAYSEALSFLADAEEAEDVAQEVMLRMWEKRSSLHPDAGLQEAYALTLTRNLCRNRHRSKVRHPLLRLFLGSHPFQADDDDALAAGIGDIADTAPHHHYGGEKKHSVQKKLNFRPRMSCIG